MVAHIDHNVGELPYLGNDGLWIWSEHAEEILDFVVRDLDVGESRELLTQINTIGLILLAVKLDFVLA
jgi:hypothetical protein